MNCWCRGLFIGRMLLRSTLFALVVLSGWLAAEDLPLLSLPGCFGEADIEALVTHVTADRVDFGPGIESRRRWLPGGRILALENRLGRVAGSLSDAVSQGCLDLTFRVYPEGMDGGFQRLAYRGDDTWYESTYWGGSEWTRVGRTWQHPGQDSPSVRCFRAPRDGRIHVSGKVFKLHREGDGVRVSILHGEQTVWTMDLAGNDGIGVDPDLDLDVVADDAIRFVVHKLGQIYCDTTGWDPVIRDAEGNEYRASESFGGTQGGGGWFYEMKQGEAADAGIPVLGSLRQDLSIRRDAMVVGRPVVLDSSAALGWIALADAADRSGMVVMIQGETPWRLEAETARDGLLRVRVLPVVDGDISSAEAGPPLPSVALMPYTGRWLSALRWPDSASATAGADSGLEDLRQRCDVAYRQLVSGLDLPRLGDVDVFLSAQGEWAMDDRLEETPAAFLKAASEQLERTRALVLRRQDPTADARCITFLNACQTVEQEMAADSSSLALARRHYLRAHVLKRAALLDEPRFAEVPAVLFCKRRVTSYAHLVGQYFGWRQRPGGGLYVLETPGYSLVHRDILGDQLPPGNILEPRLSYDAERIVFSYVACPTAVPDPVSLPVNEEGEDEAYFHIWEVGVDGSALRQLTAGTYDDMMPCYLPDDGIAFCSTRRRGYSRCFGTGFSRRWHSYTVHRMNADGSGIQLLSPNDVSEWFPEVSNDGHLLFARWDYIDRDAVTHQNLWSMRPDGSNPVAVWGNAAPSPHCTFQAKAIPGSHKIAFIASAHHAITAGPVCLLDPTVDSNSLDAITRITPQPFPEAESWNLPEYYTSPWPLSEELFLVAYSRDRLRSEGEHMSKPNPDEALGLYLLDAAGNRELLYRDAAMGATTPVALRPRTRPPVLNMLDASLPTDEGEMIISDVYQGLGDLPRGSIKELRVVQIFPKTTWLANTPRIGFAGEENARAILGTVPVAADGSARFRVPARRPLLFQVLDADGFAYQTMRSTTGVQPGEVTSCVGCHERRLSASPTSSGRPLAMQGDAAVCTPGELGGRPFSFVDVVQPVLNARCVRCHSGAEAGGGIDLSETLYQGFTRSYWSLCGNPDDFSGGNMTLENAAQAWVPRYGQRNQIQMTLPGGTFGALGSRLMQLLRKGHQEVVLEDGEWRRLAAWIDLNAVFFGSYDPATQSRELAGESLPLPDIQ